MATEVSTKVTEDPPTFQLRAETSINYDKENYKYESYLPHFVPGTQPPLEEFHHDDVGLRADPTKENLLGATGVSYEEVTPAVGTEIRGIQLSQLSFAQLDELALFAAERGVVIFRDQDFADIGPEKQKAYGRHFGSLHVHQMGGQIKDYPELLPVYRDFTAGAVDNEIKDNVTSVKWHSDMSYEIIQQRDGYDNVLASEHSGIWRGYSLPLHHSSLLRSLRNLSYVTSQLEGCSLRLLSSFGERPRDRYIREPIETIHPVVRTHPVTKQFSLYVNRLYTKRIVGMKQEESAALLGFLFDHIERGQDWHLRVHWRPGTVVVYDNRNTQHSALRDFRVEEGTTRRHMLRITPQAERPYFDQFNSS
ncbi:uncharacterized protein CCOS01_12415 [Colletotrichum costaricense]|uniref:TauD/TfdA-like domain-containing protein n=1 Tax=Colletotrichum costaricense TaxID=1209916 RepID=A0AAI9YML4_9PEZI|nr:uncharacterized protein CCOS01_12415 [Colletotrichum costaricense]KAK1516866.1 hypothetical protein CCOS01_12415 [Colletotrichum costaricense]